MGHNRDSCPERPKENRTCYTCGIKGHLSIQCSRAPPSEPEAAKRSRHIEPASNITTRAIATPRVNKTQKHLSQITTTITTVPVTTNGTPVEETQPEDAPEFEDIDIHQLEQILDDQDQGNAHLEVVCRDDNVDMPHENTNLPAYDTPPQLPSLNPKPSLLPPPSLIPPPLDRTTNPPQLLHVFRLDPIRVNAQFDWVKRTPNRGP
ncbi:hypothetical protein G6F22_019217 [Rhizopus arrhizus]|nr:hypothetical protein G6F22_019217 [Rhizopus arrhizus]